MMEKDKIKGLIYDTRVMTLAVSNDDIPWSAPVYFVFHDSAFYFFSSEKSLHIQYAENRKTISASIFQDSDQMDEIFGLQMSGVLEKINKKTLYIVLVKKYVAKFSFLKKIFGSQLIENKDFFLDKFKSHLYCFYPEKIFLSDNSRTTDKRTSISSLE